MKKYFIFLFAFVSIFATGTEKVEAVSWSGSLIQCYFSAEDAGCNEVIYAFGVNMNANKSTYAPGEVITLSSSVSYNLCKNNYANYYLTASLPGQGVTLQSGSTNGSVVIYGSGSLTAPTTPGNYIITGTHCSNYHALVCKTASIPITVSAPIPVASATLTGSGCQIAAGANSCIGSATWTITNPTAPSLNNASGVVYSNSASGNNISITLPYGSNTVTARNAGNALASSILPAGCASGLTWNGTSCMPPTATISGTGCTITTVGDDTCYGAATWNISAASKPNVYNGDGTTYSINPTGTNEVINLPYGVTTIYARDGATSLASTNLNVACDSSLAWDGSQCAVPSAPLPLPPQIGVSVDKELIRSGDTVEVEASVQASYPVSCTLSGVESSPITFLVPSSSSASVTTFTSRPLTSAQIVNLSCEAAPAITGVGSTSAEARINVVPTIQEI